VSETDYRGRTVRFEYDPAGRLVARAGAGGQRTGYRRDAGGAIVELRRQEADGSEEALTFERDAAGRIVRAGGAGVELTREYDAAGRLVAETVAGRTISFEYDLLGRCVRRTTPAGVDSTWEYGPVHELPLALHTGGQSVRFGYDALGREVARRLGPDLLLTQDWDASSRLRGIGISAGLGNPATAPRQLGGRSYAYRPDGHPTALADLGTGQFDLALDPVGRVREVTGPQWSERYAYDEVGGRAEDGRTRYEYDADGRVTVRAQRTPSGATRTWRQAWNADDQLTEVTAPDGTRWRYRYDPLGRRVAKQRLDGAGEVAETTTFCWHDYRIVERTDARNRSTTWEYRPGTYQPIAQTETEPDQSEVDSRFFAIVTDLVGAPTQLRTPAGELAWQQRDTVWGEPVSGGGSVDCPLRFPGQYRDEETGLHYNLARHYDPATGRYQSPDPLGLAAGPDPYGYARNPMVWLDPYGLACRTVYRQLSAADREAFDRGEGLVAKGTSRDIAAHIRGEDTRHISASLTAEQTERFASGNGLVAIDVDEALAGGSRYIDHGNVMQAAGRAPDASRLKPFADRAGEVLFIDNIPFSAMRLVE
jgi:RHS repeat-associated protein